MSLHISDVWGCSGGMGDSEKSSKEIGWGTILILVICIIAFPLIASEFYSWEIVRSAWDSTQEKMLVLEFAILWLIGDRFVSFLERKKCKCLQQYLDLPILTSESGRRLTVTLILFACFFCVIVPHRLYVKDEEKFGSLNNEVTTLDEELRRHVIDIHTWQEWKDAGYYEFFGGSYLFSVEFYNRCFQLEPNGFNQVQAQDDSVFFFDLLRTNQNGRSDHLPDGEAIGFFENNMNGMTNNIYKAFFREKDPSDSFGDIDQIDINLQRLEIIKERIEPRSETNFIQQTIDSIRWITNNAPK